MLAERRLDLLAGSREPESDDLRARDHDLVGRQVRELEDVVDHLLFFRRQDPGGGAGADDHLELFLRVRNVMTGGRLGEAERADDHQRGRVQHPDEWLEYREEPFRGQRDDQRGPFRTLNGHRLRGLLAQDDVEGGDDRKRDDDRNRMRADRREGVAGKPSEQRFDERGQGGLPDPPEAEGCHRDAELRGSDVGVDVFEPALDGLGQGVALLDELVDPGSADRDESELAGYEEAVRSHEEKDRQEPEQDV